MKFNLLSSLGRVSYSTHMMLYPLIGGSIYSLYSTYSESSAAANKELLEKTMPKAAKVDPDLFNPFSPIPFHNNIELKYRYADYKMHGYINPATHMNEKDYVFKGWTDSYDHSDKKKHLYNWVSMVPSHHA